MEPQTEEIATTHTLLFIISLFTSSFFIPFFVSGPQLLVGIVVNMVLFLSVRFLGLKRTIPILFLPSIGATLNGILFGTFSSSLFYFMPFIWAGNYLMIFLYERLRTYMHPTISVCCASAAKAMLLFVTAFCFISLKMVPTLFFQAMGAIQLITAFVGGMLALVVERIIFKSYVRR